MSDGGRADMGTGSRKNRVYTCGILLLAVLAAPVPSGLAQQPPAAQISGTIIDGVVVSTSPGDTSVEIRARGPLPLPVAGTALNPPRIFLDFPAVRPAAPALRGAGGGGVRRVRVALNTATPPITRVVIDLLAETPFTVVTTDRQAGRVVIHLTPGRSGSASVESARASSPLETPQQTAAPSHRAVAIPPLPPVSQLPAPAAPLTSSTSVPGVAGNSSASSVPGSPPNVPSPSPSPAGSDRSSLTPAAPVPTWTETPPAAPPRAPAPATAAGRPPAPPERTAKGPSGTMAGAAGTAGGGPSAAPSTSQPRLPAADVRRYLSRTSGTLDRFKALRPILQAIDARAPAPVDRLESGFRELQQIKAALQAVQPSRPVAATHEVLVRACELGIEAINRAGISGGTPDWNAASAAAGALLLLNQASAELEPAVTK